MFLDLLFPMNSGVLSVHRKRDLPAEESRRRVIKRIGDETRETSGQLGVEDDNEKALTARGIAKELGEYGLRFVGT